MFLCIHYCGQGCGSGWIWPGFGWKKRIYRDRGSLDVLTKMGERIFLFRIRPSPDPQPGPLIIPLCRYTKCNMYINFWIIDRGTLYSIQKGKYWNMSEKLIRMWRKKVVEKNGFRLVEKPGKKPNKKFENCDNKNMWSSLFTMYIDLTPPPSPFIWLGLTQVLILQTAAAPRLGWRAGTCPTPPSRPAPATTRTMWGPPVPGRLQYSNPFQ